jgi:hypothetical protein
LTNNYFFCNKRFSSAQAPIVTEVPSYLTPDDFAYFRSRGFTFPFGAHPTTRHIDFLQLRSGFPHILDYKPEARKEKHATTQLTICALALSRRSGRSASLIAWSRG